MDYETLLNLIESGTDYGQALERLAYQTLHRVQEGDFSLVEEIIDTLLASDNQEDNKKAEQFINWLGNKLLPGEVAATLKDIEVPLDNYYVIDLLKKSLFGDLAAPLDRDNLIIFKAALICIKNIMVTKHLTGTEKFNKVLAWVVDKFKNIYLL